ncbi:twin-arginine translocase TatA/TatE family subunit [Sphingomonas immobilis]|uniref:Sec-independent protein translocase protein TatA n=1 Tax=Sphingomonas immobilis TaxID=3063997 RepID=A0ABT8ZZ04_9SPHN|nr:twin-arginine translocase TatA/TatE family subunit [Sphingomonas sp. CA1-15]MDO7842001.1 twin-arginine translocase TatA/TatE family subunit [Sphingomonas sp. CA1-15]
MGSFSLVHWLIFGGIAILILGGGRFSNMMGDVAKGIKQFKKGMAEEDEPAREPSRIEAKKVAEPAFTAQGEKVGEDR